MADTKTSPADEIRAAVKRLRCPHAYTLTSEGRCVHCGLNYLESLIEPAEPLRIALAVWLGSLDGIEFSEHGPMPDEFVHALAVARALNGTTNREGA